jgi:hypothetical protein
VPLGLDRGSSGVERRHNARKLNEHGAVEFAKLTRLRGGHGARENFADVVGQRRVGVQVRRRRVGMHGGQSSML